MSPSAKNAQLATITENDPRWASVVARDPQPPLKFCYSVKTTGVYCRPSCAAPSQARKCTVSRDLRRRGKSRVPSVQTLQAEPSIARRTARREDRFRLSPDRKLRNPAQPRTAGTARRLERISFSPRIQGNNGAYTQRIRRRASRQACAKNA